MRHLLPFVIFLLISCGGGGSSSASSSSSSSSSSSAPTITGMQGDISAIEPIDLD